MIQDGRYTLVYSSGEYRTLEIESKKFNESDSEPKTILSCKSGSRYEGIAFLAKDNRVMLWRRFRAEFDQNRLNALQNAVNRIARNPMEAGMAYAMKEGRCCRCGRELTVPASIHAGMGPDCAEKYAWEKQDQVAVHDHVAAVRTPGSTFADTRTDSLVSGMYTPVVKAMYKALESEPIPAVPSAPAAITALPKSIRDKAMAATKRTDLMSTAKAMDNQIARQVSFMRTMESEKFFDPFGIGEKLTDAAAVNFWTKRFTANPIEDDRFWGDEFGREEARQEAAVYMREVQ